MPGRCSRKLLYQLGSVQIVVISLLAASLGGVCGCQRRPAASDKSAAGPQLPDQELLALHNRAVGLMGRFDYNGAAKLLDRLRKAEPDANPCKVDLAIALLNRRQEGDTERSIELLDEAIAGDADDPRAQYCRGLLAFHNGEMSSAMEHFERVLQLDPEDAYAWFYCGQCLLNQGKADEAIQRFQRSAALDPYLRSAYYGAFQAAQRASKPELAEEMLKLFQRLEGNPRARSAELKYSRMGPKSELVARVADVSTPAAPPAGRAFSEAQDLPVSSEAGTGWRSWEDRNAASAITVADINGDGLPDLFVTQAIQTNDGQVRNAVLLNSQQGYQLVEPHALSAPPQVNTALWGDYDNDGLIDIYLCRKGDNQLWRQAPRGEWTNVTESTGTGGGDFDTIDGACFDADHDGDLDYLLINSDGPRELLSNNRDGSFRPLAEELGIAGDGAGSRGLVVADLDADDDADLLFVNKAAPHEVYINDRLWNYHAGDEFDALLGSKLTAALAVDADVDGRVELYAAGPNGVTRWTPTHDSSWQPKSIVNAPTHGLAIIDCNGDSNADLVRFANDHWGWSPLDGKQGTERYESRLDSPTVLVTDTGPAVVAARSGKPPILWAPGPARLNYATIRFAGRTDRAAEMRSNASGIGVKGAARIKDRWASIPPYRYTTSQGWSLQPYPIGLGGADKIDYLRLLWPDSVSQTELDLEAGKEHQVVETQRQAGSCPLVFVWDGAQFAFVADVLGAGGIGFNLGRGDYYPSRPEEDLLLPPGLPKASHGRLLVKLGEPMEEICYFDAVRLAAYDLPEGWSMTLDERFGGNGPQPTGKPIFYRKRVTPTRATSLRGADITSTIVAADGTSAPIHRSDRRFIGVGEDHGVVLEFDEPLNDLSNPIVVMDGWVEYAYSQTAFAAWQAGVEYREPSIEARGADGRYRTIAPRFGYPAGTARQWCYPLLADDLPAGTTALRLTTNMQVYWDRLIVVDAEPCPDAQRKELTLNKAEVRYAGFAERVIGPQRNSRYDYNRRPPLGDTRHPAGYYTRFGDALELVNKEDNALAIIGPGEELHLEFTHLPRPALGSRRQFVLETDGWCKDADLFTKDAGTVGPLPHKSGTVGQDANNQRSEHLHRKYNTRYRSGW